MATRSLKDAPQYSPEKSPIQSGPSPFPLLIIALVIAVLLMIKVRADQNPGGVAISARAALQVTSQ
jgi:hypothetical protein